MRCFTGFCQFSQNISVETFYKISVALGVSLDQLVEK